MKKEDIKFEEVEELTCNKCKKLLGYVYAFDLNGSYFFCEECRNNLLKKNN